MSWQVSFCQMLSRLPRADRLPRVAVVGVGNELRGDDAAGAILARALRPLTARHGNLLVIDAGSAPENTSGLLRCFRPELVLLVDAAQMEAEPGAVRWLAWQATTGVGVSTHSLPLHIFASYLIAELGCKVALLGIQPADTSVGVPLSPVVREAVEATAQALADVLQGCVIHY